MTPDHVIRDRVTPPPANATIRGGGVVACALAALVSAAALTGCASVNDESSVNMFIAPRKYDNYACPDLAIQMTRSTTREAELRAMMARAEQAPGGGFVNVIAYRNEYLQTRADINVLREASVKKNCTNPGQRSSDRSVF